VRPFSLGNGTFVNEVVDLAIIVFKLCFGFEVCV
jgi:ADP-ribosylglycohydrolase